MLVLYVHASGSNTNKPCVLLKSGVLKKSLNMLYFAVHVFDSSVPRLGSAA